MWLDGPYGPDLRLETCENLVLVAQGTGILGILPIALHIASRKRQDVKKTQPAAGLDVLEVELKEAEDERSRLEQDYRPADQARLTRLKDKITGLREILNAKGATRESCFRDLTRRITILWVPDHNSQARWVGKHIQLLQDLDPVRVSTFRAVLCKVCYRHNNMRYRLLLSYGVYFPRPRLQILSFNLRIISSAFTLLTLAMIPL